LVVTSEQLEIITIATTQQQMDHAGCLIAGRT
jgi:hypothetical protein